MILGSVSKQVGESFPVDVDFARDFQRDGGAIATATVTARNKATGANTTGTVLTGTRSISGTIVSISVTGGVLGDVHLLTFAVTSTVGAPNEYEYEVELRIEEEIVPGPPGPGALQTFFYPQIDYGSPVSSIYLPEAAYIRPAEIPLRSDNISTNGTQESLFERTELRLALGFARLDAPTLADVLTWWRTWASQGKPSTLVLDRFDTCMGQWEYDGYNVAFSKALLLNNPFQPSRAVLSRAFYAVEFQFRQGT